mmetsp:Transcript_108602/g.187837  ORF Transcript_108602/g.187837 Transcript_108602/m.187837 type:complete len:289 (+) Transcript_108602:2747-3613(+)
MGDRRIEIEERLNLILVDLPMDLGAVCGFGCRSCRRFGLRLLFLIRCGDLLLLLWDVFFLFLLNSSLFLLLCSLLSLTFLSKLLGLLLSGGGFSCLLCFTGLFSLLSGQPLGNAFSLALLLGLQGSLLFQLLLPLFRCLSVLSSLLNLVVTHPVDDADPKVAAQHFVVAHGKQFHLKDGIKITLLGMVLLQLGDGMQRHADRLQHGLSNGLLDFHCLLDGLGLRDLWLLSLLFFHSLLCLGDELLSRCLVFLALILWHFLCLLGIQSSLRLLKLLFPALQVCFNLLFR